MAAPKRPHYFNSQFLIVRDFQDEQTYHDELLRRHNHLMHEWGVVRGLEVKKSTDNASFVIETGSAIDCSGREIILDTLGTLSANDVQTARQAAGTGQDIFVTIVFREEDSTEADDKYPGGSQNVTRKVQSPLIVATKSAASDGKVIILAKIDAKNVIDNLVRKMASSIIARGSNLGDISLDGTLSFTAKAPNPTYPQVGLDYDSTSGQLRIRASSQSTSILDTTHVKIKRDTGNVGIGTPDAPSQKLEVYGTLKLSANPTPNNDNFGAYFWNQDRIGPTIAGLGFEVRTGGNTPRLKISSTGNVGIGTPGSAMTKLEIIGNNTALPATTGSTQSVGHIARLKSTINTDTVLDIGAGEKSFWLQSTEGSNLATNNSLLLNPNGGNVGIRTTSPRSSLHIRKDNSGRLGPPLTLMNGLGTAGAKVHIDLHTYWDNNRPNPTGRIVCEDTGTGSAHVIFQTKESNTSETMVERLRLDGSGSVTISGDVGISGGIGISGGATISGKVGIGTPTPKANLDVGDLSSHAMKSILARMEESNPGTYLGVNAHHTQQDPVSKDKCFSLEHYFYNHLNGAINFHRGMNEKEGFITLATDDGKERLRVDKNGLSVPENVDVKGNVSVQGTISCGGIIAIKSATWNTYIAATDKANHPLDAHGDQIGPWEKFTIAVACSREFKENISDLTAFEAMATLQNLTPVKYDYKGEKTFRPNLGFIAEDMPDNLASEDRKSISPFEVVPILTKVAKEQQRVIAELKETIRTLQDAVLG